MTNHQKKQGIMGGKWGGLHQARLGFDSPYMDVRGEVEAAAIKMLKNPASAAGYAMDVLVAKHLETAMAMNAPTVADDAFSAVGLLPALVIRQDEKYGDGLRMIDFATGGAIELCKSSVQEVFSRMGEEMEFANACVYAFNPESDFAPDPDTASRNHPYWLNSLRLHIANMVILERELNKRFYCGSVEV